MSSKRYRDQMGGSRASSRSVSTRKIKKRFIIITEGETEQAYFTMGIFKPQEDSDVNVQSHLQKIKRWTRSAINVEINEKYAQEPYKNQETTLW